MQKNSFLKKILVLILAASMLIGIFPNPAMTAIDTTKTNSAQQNQEILEILKGIFGDDIQAQAILETMNRLGLLDENGEFTSAGVEVDGRILTLDEVKELVSSEGVDLNRVVSVDGTELTLGNLKIMIEIEDELRRIKDTYFRDDVSLNSAQIGALSSIREQIETEGIQLFSLGSFGSAKIPSGIDHTIYAIVDTTTVTCNNGSGAQSGATVTLKDSSGATLTQVPNYNISIPYRFVDGSAKNGINYSGSNGTLTFTAGSSETTKAVPFSVNNDTSRFNGEKAFLIQFFEPQNIFFDGNMLASEIVVKINKTYTWRSTVNVIKETWFNYLSYGPEDRLGVYNGFEIANDDDMSLLMEEGLFSAVKVVFSHNSDTFEAGNYSGHVTLGEFYFPGNTYDRIDFNIGRIEKGKVTTYRTTSNPSFVLHPERMYKTRMGYQANNVYNGGSLWFDVNPDELTIPAHHPKTFNYKFDITFYDAKAPSVKSVTIPQGISFQYGQSVPVIAEFSEPVNLTNVRMTVNGQILSPLETGNGVRKATFVYAVKQKEDGSASLGITGITGGVDLSGFSQEAFIGTTLIFGLDELSKYYSFSTSASANAVADADFNITCTADIPISSNDFTRWIDNERILDASTGTFMAQSVYASIDGGTTRIPLYCVEGTDGSLASLRCTFTPELNTSGIDETRAVEFYYTDDNYDNPAAQYKNLVGKYATFTVPPAIFLEAGDISIADDFPAAGIVFLQEGASFKLTYTVNKTNATWKAPKDFTWSSSNTTVATIDQNGIISLTGQPSGSTPVFFTLTAKNGNVAGKAVSVNSKPLTVKVGLTPFLSIPAGTNHISVRSGEDAEVRWTSNLIAKYAESGQNAVFTVKTFPAVYDDEGNLSKGDIVKEQTVSGNTANPVASCFVPASVLNGISVTGRYSYIVEVSAVNPYKTSETLEATAYISIDSQPAVVRLRKLDSYFITDAVDSVNLSWTIKNFDTINDPEFALEIMDNSDGSIVWSQKDTQDEGDSYNLPIKDVDSGFKDVYTVTVKAKNSADSTWSYDSFVLYVYSDEAMKIWIDGVTAGQTLDMSNIGRISKMTSEQILALNRDIYLKHVISINYGEHTWGQISDQIKWRSSDSNVASINFKEVSTYSNIENLKYTSYRPTDTFILSGLNNGQTRITATHSATNKTQTIDVRVDTLKDKLYLFQISPKAKSTLTYINGNGKKCTVDTNENGELALYEESGIKSEIHMKSANGGKEYIGTLYKTVSSEKDYTKLELYPVNYFKLREISTAELYFKKPDGSVFSGDVILRGGVYKNGEYCADAKLNGKIGTEDQIIMIGADGKFTVEMDPYQFWVKSSDEVLNASDDLEFVFEVRFPDDEYYPRLLDVNCRTGYEDAIKFGNKTVRVEEVPAGSKEKPFTVTQYIDYGFKSGALMDVLKFTGKIGPGQTSEEAKLITTVFWWGEDLSVNNKKHTLTLKDEYGTIPRGQVSGSLIYPFSTIKATRNTFVMNSNTMDGWLESGDNRGMVMVETAADGSQYKVVTLPFSIINMIGMERAEDSEDINAWYGSISDYFKADAGDLNIDDKVIQAGLDFLCNLSIDKEDTGGMFSIALSPTADPTVFTAFICLNLGNMSNDNATGIYAEESIDSDLDYTPGMSDILAMQKGKYTEKTKKTYKDNSSKKKSGAGSVHYTFGGYMEADVRYNADNEKWEFTVLNGGINAGGGYSKSWNYNTAVGGVPVTAQFTVGGTAEVIFKAVIQRGKDIEELYDKDSVRNYLTTLRLYAYMRAFAGLGFDYSVAALKIGLFGQISFDAQFAFLDQPDISEKAKGQKISVDGKVGIEFVAKFAFISYEKVLASADFNLVEKTYQDWEKVQDTWKDINKKESEKRKEKEKEYGLIADPIRYLSAPILYPVSSNVVIERREYLDKFERSWNEPVRTRGLLMSSGVLTDEVKLLQTNSYPYSNPVLTEDGQIMLYVSDGDSTYIEDTEVRWTKLTGGSYPDGKAVETSPGGYGDSQLKLAGDQSFASAVWVKQGKKIDKDAGDPVTNADIALISNSTEVMAAIYDGSDWTAAQLTNNAAPDLAPAVATNGKYVLAAWRNVYAADSRDPLNFSSSDTILYRIYNKDTGIWSDPQTLYNGTSGAVKGLEASMLEDGTSAVAYTIDANDIEETGPVDPDAVCSSLETVCAVVDKDGGIVKNVRYTNDLYLDENPQITTVMFEDGIERFVLGWYSEHDADGIKVNDIRLCAFDNKGVLYNKFIESINSVNANAIVNISRNFRFVNNAESIDELSILWTETQNAHITDESEFAADKDLLKAVKFKEEDRYIYITSPLEVAEMDDYTLINHFSAYNSDINTVKAVLLGTNYGGGYEERTIHVEENGITTMKTISVPIAVSNLYTATGTYENNIGINYVAVDYTSVIRGMTIPVQFSVYNAGVEPIESITLQIGGKSALYEENFLLLPNESITLTAYYDVPVDRLDNPRYTVTAEFQSGETDVETDLLYLDIPDVGISKLDTLSDDDGKRVMQVTVYNNSDSILAGSGRDVRIGFYSDEDCTVPVTEVSGQESGKMFTVDAADLALIDAGAYTRQFTFDIGAHVGAGQEIPDAGVRLYAKVWIEELVDPSDVLSGTDTIVEYNAVNNVRSVLFESLLKAYGDPVTISTEQTNEDGSTEAVVTLKNNSLANTATGNLIVSLQDNSGNILESMQCYDPGEVNNGLISLSGEGTARRAYSFSRAGASLAVSYSNAVLDDDDNAELASLSLTGIPLKLESGKKEYEAEVKNLTNTFISAATSDPDATVTVNGKLAEMGNMLLNLRYGINKINIKVTASDSVTVKNYTVTVINTRTIFDDDSSSSEPKDDDSADSGVIIDITDEEIARLINLAGNNGNRILINPTFTGEEGRIEFNLNGAGMSGIAASGATLGLNTPILNLILNPAAIAYLAENGYKKISIIIEITNGNLSVSILADGKKLNSLNGYITAQVPVPDAGRGTVAALVNSNGEMDIIRMSAVRDGLLTVTLTGSAVFAVINNALDFNDTDQHWAAEYIDFVTARNLFQGTGENQFSPQTGMTRGMIVTVLGRLSGAIPGEYDSTSFSDVGEGAYYAGYVEWAARNGIVQGVGQGLFSPDQNVTREQLAVILYNYIRYMGLTLPQSTADNEAFADDDEISGYARDGVAAMQRAGIINGKNGNRFDPKGKASRAEVAAMLERLVSSIVW